MYPVLAESLCHELGIVCHQEQLLDGRSVVGKGRGQPRHRAEDCRHPRGRRASARHVRQHVALCLEIHLVAAVFARRGHAKHARVGQRIELFGQDALGLLGGDGGAGEARHQRQRAGDDGMLLRHGDFSATA